MYRQNRIRADLDGVASNAGYDAAVFCQDADAGVTSRLVFHAGTDERSLCAQQRYCLALHVRTHEGTVGIVVFQEGDHGCTDGNDFLRRYVHEVDAVSPEFTGIFTVTAGNAFVDEMAIFGQRFVGLGDDVLFFFISRDVVDIFRNDDRFFIDAADGASMKPNSLTLPKQARDEIKPMFGPSGVSTGHMRP